MTIIQNEYARSSVVFDVDYRTGSIADKSPYKAAATVAGSVNWARTNAGHGIKLNGGTLSYADNAANRLADGAASFIIFGDINLSSEFLLYKRNNSIVSYQIYVNTPNVLSVDFYDGTDTRSMVSTGLRGRKLLVITLINGTAPRLYLDGALSAVGDGVITIPSSNNTSELFIGTSRTGVYAPRASTLSRITLLNRVLSPAEISQLYQELSAERYPLRAYSFGCRISAPKDPPGVAALLKTDFTTRLADGRLADLSGNGWHGTVKPGFAAGPGMCGQALLANSASRTYVDFGEVPINGVSKLTMIHYGQRGASNPSEILFDKGAAANNRNEINQSTTQITWNVGSGGTIYPASISDSNVSTPLFQSWAYNGDAASNSDKVKVNIDNSTPAVTVAANFPTTLPNTTGTPLTFGRLGWLSNFPPPKQNEYFALYSSTLTQDQVSYIYKQIARRSTFQCDLQRVPVSLANMVGPAEVPNTPFRILSGGTWKVSEDARGKHWFESVAGNWSTCHMPSTQAYGTYVFDVSYKNTATYIWPISNTQTSGAANRNAYSIVLTGTSVIFEVFTPGSATTLFTAANAITENTDYSFAVTRSSDGTFTWYIKGGAYKTWTLLVATSGTNPIVHNTYKTSSYFLFMINSAAAGSKFSQPRFFAGPFSLDMLKVHCP